MELQLSADDAAFRDEVREFFRDNLAPDLKQKVEIGQEVAPEHYKAVAAAIRYAEKMRALAREKGWG